MPMRLLGAQIAAPTASAQTSGNVSSAKVVLVQNTGTTSRLVTLETAAEVTIGTFNVPPNGNIQLEKAPTDQIFAANASVKLTPIAYHY